VASSRRSRGKCLGTAAFISSMMSLLKRMIDGLMAVTGCPMALILFFSANALMRLPIAGFSSQNRFKRMVSTIFCQHVGHPFYPRTPEQEVFRLSVESDRTSQLT